MRTWPDRPPVNCYWLSLLCAYMARPSSSQCYWLSLLCAYMARPSSSQLLLVESAMCVHGPTVLQSVLLVESAVCVHGPTVLQSIVTGWVCYVRTWPDRPPVSCYWLGLLCAYMARPSSSQCYWLSLLCAYMARPSSSQLLLVESAMCVHGPTVLQSVVTG